MTRLPWGTRVDPQRLSLLIEGDRKRRLEQLAAHMNVSAAVFLERVIDHLDDELDTRGRPTWWPEQDELHDGELPIDSA